MAEKRVGEKMSEIVISIASWIVFTLFDLLEIVSCMIYKYLDAWFDDSNSKCVCYCHHSNSNSNSNGEEDDDDGMSETLYRRNNIFRNFTKNYSIIGNEYKGLGLKRRWSDCGCSSCLSWQNNEEKKLHVVLMEDHHSKETDQNCAAENVIFLHGFLSSSSFWVESVFPNISKTGLQNYRLFAVDLLGFGKSPKPWDCSYTLKDHIEMIEQSVIVSSNLKTFHIVAHSMGCIIALGLASKYSKSIKSITLVAPPYFPSPKEEASLIALNRLAKRTLWPPLLFASSFMSWYEHLGRSVCFLYCRNHQIWESILKLIFRTRELHFQILDSTRHTHHSAWHTMHNVICGGAKQMDEYLEAVKLCGAVFTVIQGDKDSVVPLECSRNMKTKIPHAKVEIISNADHNSVIFGREQQFTEDLEQIWK